MRILIWGMSENIGGIETFIMELYRNIDRSKIQFDFLCAHDSLPIAFEDEIVDMGGRVFRVMYSESESLIKSRSCLMHLFHEHPEIKGIHVHANFPYAFPLKYAKKAGIQLRILHSHNSAGIEKQTTKIRKVFDNIRKWQIAYQIKKYPTMYLACSDIAGRYMFKNKPFLWIKNGIHLEEFVFDESIRKEYRLKLGIGETTKVIGFIGRYREQKNPLYLLEIFKEYTKLNEDSVLLMIGMGRMQEEIDKKIAQLEIGDKVIQLGRREDTNNLYKVMDAFLLPSLYEGLPVVLVEAQTAGVPCFVSDAITNQVCLTDLIHYYPISKEPAAWAELIRKQLGQYQRKDYPKQISEKGFDMKDVAKEVERIYLSR